MLSPKEGQVDLVLLPVPPASGNSTLQFPAVGRALPAEYPHLAPTADPSPFSSNGPLCTSYLGQGPFKMARALVHSDPLSHHQGQLQLASSFLMHTSGVSQWQEGWDGEDLQISGHPAEE